MLGVTITDVDIQPCNVIVSGGTTTDDLWYSDEYDVDGRVMRMARGCRITLIDFGFARALGPRDMVDDDDKAAHHAATPAGEIADGPCFADRALEDVAAPGSRRGRPNAFNARREVGTTVDQYNDDSISRRRVLDISAVGTRSYAAPEILSGIRSLVVDNLNSSSLRRSNNNKGRSFDDRFTPTPNPTKTLGSCVSNYGMVADAFSVGATIRHMVTGVPPNVDVGDFMAWRDHPLMRLSRSLGRCIRRKDKRRRKKYRSCADLPLDARNLIHNLTHYDPSRRATVRSVTRHPWIETSGAEADAYPESGPGGPIAYLKCAEN
ncbi:hypothetical protein ACHAXA_000283 [Cyclostephanos tholiformis]|uniref:Protein kinase domain-containing protein n=1 Tax=Cyclostephanos tholiformis TaxID=382380 RepID=A0ABD3R1L2_9STRA